MNEHDELKICGLVRNLKKVQVAQNLVIASFVIKKNVLYFIK